MIYRIVVYIILAVNMILYCIKNSFYFEIINEPLCIALVSISISMYMFQIIKNKNQKIIISNIIFTGIVTCIFPPLLPNLVYLITEYLYIKNYNGRYILMAFYIMLAIKFNIDTTSMLLGVIAIIFTHELLNYEAKLDKIEKDNYKLKEKNYSLEEKRKREDKIAYQNIEAVKIEERSMISQKLHDKIGHTLSGSIIQLEAVKIVIPQNTKKGMDILEDITTNLRNGMDDIRQTLRTIKPEQEQLSINNLKVTLDDFTKKSNIKTNLKIEGDLNEINLVYWRALIECCRETLTNTIKYSNGDLLNIEISVLNKIIRLHIKDNGYYKQSLKKGMGLLGIEERIINLGGDVYFDNEEGFSTLIMLKR